MKIKVINKTKLQIQIQALSTQNDNSKAPSPQELKEPQQKNNQLGLENKHLKNQNSDLTKAADKQKVEIKTSKRTALVQQKLGTLEQQSTQSSNDKREYLL